MFLYAEFYFQLFLNKNDILLRKLFISNNKCCRKYCKISNTPDYMNIFDRKAKLYQRERTADLPEYEVYDYLKEKVGYAVADRIKDIKRKFNRAVDLGCGRGYVSRHITSKVVEELFMCDRSQKILDQAHLPDFSVKVKKIVTDEEAELPFENDSVDIVLSCLSLHWVNDLPGTFNRIISCLKPDGVFIGALFGGETLFELRSALHLAQLEREGGISSHVSPFTETRDVGSLLTRAGFRMLTIDLDEITIGYPTMFELMWDLKGMGENNATWTRSVHLWKDTMFSASAIYQSMYGKGNNHIPATFQIINFIAWKPDPSQPKSLERGSAKYSFRDVENLEEMIKNMKLDAHSSDDDTKK